jgi:CDGSH-type Zn-finger protein
MGQCKCGNTQNEQGQCDGSHANIKKEEEKK